ncbi:hypothetical protein TRVL_09997 [Trypanosoma vivax]|nr:hypothetical protein TRVL_09997 [Trypanosoma vivax]
MEVSAEKAEYTLFGTRQTNLSSLKVGDTVLREERVPKLLGLTVQPHKRSSKHALSIEEVADARPTEPRQVAPPEWGPEREKLRAFYLALVQNKMCYGVASWWFETSLSDRERLERVQTQAGHILAGVPKAFDREHALREARLKPINEVPHRRVLHHCLRLKAKGPVHTEGTSSIFPPERPIYVRLAMVQHSFGNVDGPERPHNATVSQLARRVHFNIATPGVLKANAPKEAQEGAHNAASAAVQ